MPTMPNSWWKPSKTNRTTRRTAKAKLRVEQLEDRITPTVVIDFQSLEHNDAFATNIGTT